MSDFGSGFPDKAVRMGRHLAVGAAISIGCMGLPAAYADAVFGQGELAPLAPVFEQPQCVQQCETSDWRIQVIVAPAGTSQKITSTDKLFQITGKAPNYCGSAGCVEAYVLRDATGLHILKAGYAITRTSPLVAAEILSLATRSSLPSVQRFATNDASVSGWNVGKQAFARDILTAYSNNLVVVNRIADHADYALLAHASYGMTSELAKEVRSRGWDSATPYVAKNALVGNTVATLFTSKTRTPVLAFRGSQTGGDWVTNLVGTVLPSSIIDAEIQGARSIAMKVVIDHPSVVFVGHSLGGRLAKFSRLSTGNSAVVFNSAPLGLGEIAQYPQYFIKGEAGLGQLLAFRSPEDPLTELSPASMTTILNIERTGQDIGGNTLNIDYTHSRGVLATAMQNVRIARDEGWISYYIAGTVPQSVPVSTPQGNHPSASAVGNRECPQVGGQGIDARTAADCATIALAEVASAVEKLSNARAEGKISGALGQAMSELMARNPQAESMQLSTCRRLGSGGANEMASAACLALVWSKNPQIRREASDMFDKVVDDLNSALAANRLPLTTVPPVYVVKGACPSDGCKFGMWTATGNRPLFDSPGSSTVVAQVVRGERVAALRSELRLRPVKGMVVGRIDHLKQGEIIYLMDYVGAGLSNVWARGQVFADPRGDDGCTPTPLCKSAIRFPVEKAPHEWWVRVQKRNGESGWIRPDIGPWFYGTSWIEGASVDLRDPNDKSQ